MVKIITIIFGILIMTTLVVGTTWEWKYNPYSGYRDRSVQNLSWTNLTGYPVACPSYSSITQLDDSVTCTDSWVNIAGDNMTGNLNATGNITSENVFLPQYIFSHTNETIPVTGASQWTNITFSQEDTDVKRGITHTYNDATNHTFIISEDGIYNVDYDLDIQDTSASASDIDVAARLTFINGTEIIGSVFEIDITKQGTEAELSHNFLAECTAGDQFVFQFIADDADVQISTHGTFGDYPESASIIMNKIANS